MKKLTTQPIPIETVDSTSSDPHWSGPIELVLSDESIKIRWAGEDEWQRLEWWELLRLLSIPNPTAQQVLEDLKSAAIEDPWKEVAADEEKLSEVREKAAYERGLNAGRKVLVLPKVSRAGHSKTPDVAS